jgi:lipopolysaccharide exporter
VSVLVWQTGKVLFPAFSKLRSQGGDVGAAYLVSLRYIALLAGPVAVGMFLLADPIVATLFGEKWAAAAPALQALAVFAGLRALGSQTGEVLKASGRPDLLAGLALLKAALLVPALLLASRGGITAVAWTVTGVGAVTTLLDLAVSTRIAGLRAVAIPHALRASAVATLILAVSVVASIELTRGAPPVYTLLLATTVGAATFFSAILRLDPDMYRQAARALSPRRRATLPETAS